MSIKQQFVSPPNQFPYQPPSGIESDGEESSISSSNSSNNGQVQVDQLAQKQNSPIYHNQAGSLSDGSTKELTKEQAGSSLGSGPSSSASANACAPPAQSSGQGKGSNGAN